MISGLVISGLNEESKIELLPLYKLDSIPIEESEIIKNEEICELDHLKNLRITEVNTEVELILGSNVSQAMEPWKVVNSKKYYEPYAIYIICGAIL